MRENKICNKKQNYVELNRDKCIRKGFDKIGKARFEIKRRRNKKCNKKMFKECS